MIYHLCESFCVDSWISYHSNHKKISVDPPPWPFSYIKLKIVYFTGIWKYFCSFKWTTKYSVSFFAWNNKLCTYFSFKLPRCWLDLNHAVTLGWGWIIIMYLSWLYPLASWMEMNVNRELSWSAGWNYTFLLLRLTTTLWRVHYKEPIVIVWNNLFGTFVRVCSITACLVMRCRLWTKNIL